MVVSCEIRQTGDLTIAKRITGRHEGSTGSNTHYRLSGGEIVTRPEGVRMQKRGEIEGCHVMKRNGKEFLRDNPNKSERDNIDKQPLI